jgi:hypothetical protein
MMILIHTDSVDQEDDDFVCMAACIGNFQQFELCRQGCMEDDIVAHCMICIRDAGVAHKKSAHRHNTSSARPQIY